MTFFPVFTDLSRHFRFDRRLSPASYTRCHSVDQQSHLVVGHAGAHLRRCTKRDVTTRGGGPDEPSDIGREGRSRDPAEAAPAVFPGPSGISVGDGMETCHDGCVATFKKQPENDGSSRPGAVSCSHLEQRVDELNLSPNIRTAHPPRLPLPDHVHGLVSLDRAPRRVKCTKALLGLHASFDRAMILLHDVVQVVDRSVAAPAPQDSFRLHS